MTQRHITEERRAQPLTVEYRSLETHGGWVLSLALLSVYVAIPSDAPKKKKCTE